MRPRFLFIFILSIGVALTACKKDDGDDDTGNGGNTPTPGQGTMTCKVDGNDWSASLAVVATNSNGVFTVTGSDANAKQCQVTVMNVNGPGTYELGGSMTNPNTGRWTASTDPADTYSSMLGQGSGTVEITTLTTTKAEGTFSFTAKNTAQQQVSITSGSFSADIQ
jgi:hypothetical protein